MVEKVEEREHAAPAILAGVAGGVTAGGIVALLGWLTAQARAAPPEGAVIFSPDEWTKEAIIGGLAALGEISGNLSTLASKLDTQINLLEDIKELLAAITGVEEIPGIVFRLEVTPISGKVIPGVPATLYEADSPEKGALIAVELVSDSKDVQYDLHLDDMVWSFNVSDMIDQSIEYPHFPGGWIAKATGATFVFMFSSGATSDMRYRTNFRLQARATSTNPVTITRGELVRKVYE